MSKLSEEEIEQIARIVAAATETKADEAPARSGLVKVGGFFLTNWPLTVLLLSAVSFFGAIAYEGASPLYYFKKIAAEDRKVSAELRMHEYREDLTRRHLELGYKLLDQGLQDDALAEFKAAQVISVDSIPAALAIRTAELFKQDAFAEYSPSVFKTRVVSLFGETAADSDASSEPQVHDPHVLAYLGDFYRWSGDSSAATSAYDAALAARPTLAHAVLGLGHIAYDAGDFAGAEARYRRAHELYPENPDYLANLASALRLVARHEDAITFFLEVARLDPDRLAPIAELCLTLRAEERYAESYNALRQTRAYLATEENRNRLFTKGGKNDPGWLIVIADTTETLSAREEKLAFLDVSAGLSAALLGRKQEARALIQDWAAAPRFLPQVSKLMQAEIAFLKDRYPARRQDLDGFRAMLIEAASRAGNTD
ncbi:tetratricopeptide repeat protein [Pelagibius marinus]|uniref:tetratricopeptide repeat protein n=1 Tax=Pelagibius marinus TaxID=2762760 RepID=UPI00187224C1|nr:tetratricopeptide repeat protein [Pelagibius marinus]